MMKTVHAFTLAEVLIVVSILGIMAALVVPHYNSSTAEAQLAALQSNLHVVRKQLELYKIHHNGLWPAAVGETSADFTRRMVTKTDGGGAPGTKFGPYQERMPVNKYNGRATVRIGGAAAGTGTDGWRFDPLSGEFQADDNYDGNNDGGPDHVGL
ncbi:MAG: prepilin-type N-terminal cleavage/methylation domain-containing protein [Planctomycetes bacterium]|nr:prepilin-type N-terminal cleavage/methylation domain-containing protein [Planctomycetota bacterium]